MRARFIILTATFALLSIPSIAADRYVVRDNSGKRIETVEKSYGDTLTRYRPPFPFTRHRWLAR